MNKSFILYITSSGHAEITLTYDSGLVDTG